MEIQNETNRYIWVDNKKIINSFNACIKSQLFPSYWGYKDEYDNSPCSQEAYDRVEGHGHIKE